jgi:hypothetical protein
LSKLVARHLFQRCKILRMRVWEPVRKVCRFKNGGSPRISSNLEGVFPSILYPVDLLDLIINALYTTGVEKSIRADQREARDRGNQRG